MCPLSYILLVPSQSVSTRHCFPVFRIKDSGLVKVEAIFLRCQGNWDALIKTISGHCVATV